MFEFIRGESIKGVIVNKMIDGVRIGGPCFNNEPVILHNIPNVEGSSEVIEGVYWHDGNLSDLQEYRQID